MKKITVLFALITLINQALFCQQDITLKNITPPSPEASAFVKYGTYPIGTYTGRPDITIPIYEIKEAGLSVPISLSYDATGIRVNDMASWAGMNWSLNAGGMISQMVIGQPDKAALGQNFEVIPPRSSEIVNNTTYFNYLQSLVDGDFAAPSKPDAEPDKFFYSFNGRSGSFVFDRDRNIMQIPKTSLKISVIGAMQGFNITDETGTTYVFNFQERTETYNYSAAGPGPYAQTSGSVYTNHITGYYLTQINSNDGLNHINFIYENETSGTKDDMYSETYGNKFNQGNQFPSSNYHEYRWNGTQRVITIPRLKTITFSNGKVEFTRVAGRQDDAGQSNSSRLDEITVYQKKGTDYLKLKSFKFVHGYYYSAAAYAQYSGFPNQTVDRYRLRLDALKLKDALGNEIAGYTFSYNGTELPPKTSCSQDWWGYYNGKPNTTLVPTTTIPIYNGTVTIGGGDRNADEVYMKAGILEKIVYPTGGYTKFETESHKLYSDYSIVSDGSSVNAQGMSSNNLNVQTFVAPPTLQNGGAGTLRVNIGPYSSGYPQPFVKIKDITSGQEQTFTSTDMTQWYNATFAYTFISGDTYELTASCYVNQSYGTANLIATFTKSIYDPHTDPVGGLRIKSIKNYSADNTLANEENYAYGLTENGGGVFVGVTSSAYYYARGQRVYWAPNYNGCWNIGGPNQYDYEVYQGGPLYDPALVQGSPVVYTDVVKYFGNSTGNAGKTIYNYGTAIQQMAQTVPLPAGQNLANNQGILIINDTWKKGQLLKQQNYKRNDNSTYSLVQENENIYNTLYTDITYGLIAQIQFDRVIMNSACGFRYFTDYAFAEYPVNTGYMQLAQSISKTYAPNGIDFAQTTVDHTYDNLHKDIEVKTTTLNSKGQTIESEKRYPFNKSQLTTSLTAAESTAIDDMDAKNIVAPIEEIQRNNSTQVALTKTSYEYVNGSTIAPVNLRFQKGSNPIETRLLFTKYDALGNLLEQQKVNDVKQSYLYGYNKMYPVAQVIGADNTTIAALVNQTVLDDLLSTDQQIRNELNNLRTGLAGTNALVTTYTYAPLVGMTSATDPNGRTTYYSYDAFNRLQLVRDQDGKILKKICYNYAGQPGDCSVNVSPSWTATGNLQCETDGNNNYTGIQLREEKDTNPNSPSFNQTQWVSNGVNTSVCPVPSTCDYATCESNGPQYHCVYGTCEIGYQVYTDSYYDYISGQYLCTYHYEWSDGTWSQNYQEYNSNPCPF